MDKQEWPSPVILSEQQIDAIAERAAKKVYDRFAMTVGWRVIRGASYVVGAAIIALAVVLGKYGFIK
jgi:hypothetical protein